MEEIKLLYNDFDKNIILNYFNNKILQNEIEIGIFILNNNVLEITWNENNNTDIFILNNESNNNDILIYKYNNNKNNEIIYSININNIIIKLNDIEYDYTIDNNNLLRIKINENYESLYKLDNNNLYIDITDAYNEEINVKSDNWSEICVFNSFNNFFYRKNLPDENGVYEKNNDEIILNWKKWDKEYFICKNNEYIKKQNESYIFYHKDWTDKCELNNNQINKISNLSEKGIFSIENNFIIIKWDKWDSEKFIKLDEHYYLYNYFINKIIINNDCITYIYNSYNNKLYLEIDFSIKYCGDIKFDNEYIYIKFYENIEFNKYLFKQEYDDKNIKKYILYTNLIEEFNVFKSYDEILCVNIFDNSFYIKNTINKNGNIKFNEDKSILNIYWNKYKEEKYILYFSSESNKNIYLYEEHIKLHNTKILLYNNEYTIDLFNFILYNDYKKIKFLKEENKFCLYEINEFKTYYLKAINDINILTSYNDDIDYELYRVFQKEFEISTDLEIYNDYFINGKNRIYSVKSFKQKYPYVDIYSYSKYNNIISERESIIHWNKNSLSNKYFDTNNKISVCYNSFIDIFNNKILYVINVNNIEDLNNILEYISKIYSVCILLNVNDDIFDINNYFNKLKLYYKNLLIIKHIGNKDIDSFYIMNYLYSVLLNNNYKFEKIIYFKNINNNIEDYIININKISFNKFYLLDISKEEKFNFEYIDIIENIFKYNKYNKYDIVLSIIFIYLIYNKYFYIYNNNLLIKI